MDADSSTHEITSNKIALKNLFLKTVVLVILILLPIFTLWICQYALEAIIGPPDPSNFSWMGIAGIILFWYILTYAVLLPHAGRTIDSNFPP